ncbi:MAG: tryptophan-rich sensory protein [Flavobacteriales bacterium]|nr:tryptophan-rich sensory protein [Flavobacteriales bacterium]
MLDRTFRLLDTASPAWKVGIAIVVTLLLGSASGLVTAGAVEGWYMEIEKPSFNPPNSVFGPVWTVLYILMGFAAGLVWSNGTDDPQVRRGLLLYGLQLLLNVLWSLLFFGLKSPGLALVDITLLLLTIILCIRAFHPIDRWAAYLMMPYLLWVSFASVLNAAIHVLN